MLNDQQDVATAHLVDWRDFERFDVMGPVVQFLAPVTGNPDLPCVMRGTVAPGVIIPLHSHADPETFIQVSGELECLAESAGASAWMRIRPGEVFHVPGGAKHAFRNRSSEPAVSIIVSTRKLGSFLASIGIRASQPDAGLVSPERIQKFLTTAETFGYWNAGPEENARFGLDLKPPDQSAGPTPGR
jgi:quercetin dioxygenase-like cupin family protein